jgi:hypothetical protein
MVGHPGDLRRPERACDTYEAVPVELIDLLARQHRPSLISHSLQGKRVIT